MLLLSISVDAIHLLLLSNQLCIQWCIMQRVRVYTCGLRIQRWACDLYPSVVYAARVAASPSSWGVTVWCGLLRAESRQHVCYVTSAALSHTIQHVAHCSVHEPWRCAVHNAAPMLMLTSTLLAGGCSCIWRRSCTVGVPHYGCWFITLTVGTIYRCVSACLASPADTLPLGLAG
jgi:hypothetical protein